MSQARSSGTDRETELELPEDFSFQKREWFVQRIGWAAMLALVIAAAAGLAGSGSISSTSRSAGGLTVEYERFGRLEAPEQVRVLIEGRGQEQAELWIGTDFLRRKQIERITPEPREVRAGQHRHVFVFYVAEEGASEITFHLRPDSPGRAAGQIGIAGGPALELWQFVYP